MWICDWEEGEGRGVPREILTWPMSPVSSPVMATPAIPFLCSVPYQPGRQAGESSTVLRTSILRIR